MSHTLPPLERRVSPTQSLESSTYPSTDNESFATANSNFDDDPLERPVRAQETTSAGDAASIAETIIPDADETATNILVVAPTLAGSLLSPPGTSSGLPPVDTATLSSLALPVQPDIESLTHQSVAVSSQRLVSKASYLAVAPPQETIGDGSESLPNTGALQTVPSVTGAEPHPPAITPSMESLDSLKVVSQQPVATAQPGTESLKVEANPGTFGEQQQQENAKKQRYQHTTKDDCVLFWLSAVGCYGICGDCPCNTTSGSLASILGSCFAFLSVGGCATCLAVCKG